jgi:hypothetical protein
MPLTPEQFEGLKELAEQGAGRFEMFKYIAGFIKKKSGKYGILPSSVGTLLADECNNDSEFAAQMFEANLISWAFWEKQGRVNLHNKDFQVGLYNKNVENRLGWSQKTEITGKDGKDLYANAKESNMTPEEAYNALKENI